MVCKGTYKKVITKKASKKKIIFVGILTAMTKKAGTGCPKCHGSTTV
jgi:hypothetical protein